MPVIWFVERDHKLAIWLVERDFHFRFLIKTNQKWFYHKKLKEIEVISCIFLCFFSVFSKLPKFIQKVDKNMYLCEYFTREKLVFLYTKRDYETECEMIHISEDKIKTVLFCICFFEFYHEQINNSEKNISKFLIWILKTKKSIYKLWLQ